MKRKNAKDPNQIEAPFDYGVQGKKPSRKQKSRKYPGINRTILYLIAALIVIGGSVYTGIYFSGKTIVKSVVVQGTVFTADDRVIESAAVDPGTFADSIGVMDVIRRVESLPYIRRASVTIPPGGRMQIRVTEREPMAYLMQGDAMVMVDADGIKMPIPGNNIPDLPLLYGFNVNPLADTLKGNSWNAVSEFLTSLHNNKLAAISISEVGWHVTDGVFALSREQGVRLIFGHDAFSTKLDYWKEFYRQVVPRKGIGSFTSLDFRFRNQIVARES